MQRVVTNASELCEIGIEVIMRKDDDMYQGDVLMMIEKNERGVRKRRMDMRTGCVYSTTTTGCVCSAIALLMKRV